MEGIGGIAYLSTLPDAVPSAANLDYYLSTVREKFLLRKLIQTCTTIVGSAYDWEGHVEELVNTAAADVNAIAESTNARGMKSMLELTHKAIDQIEKYHQQGGQIQALTTGIIDFDKMTWGLKPGDMVVIAARPSVGKSSAAMQIAEHVAVDCKKPVGVFSLEMTDDQLVLRMLCSRSRVNLRNIRDGFMAERDFPKLANAAGHLGKAPIYIDDSSGLSILQLRAKARRMAQLYHIELLIIDYLQLLSSHRRHSNRNEEITYISNNIKQMARELRIPVIVLSQLNREVDKRGDNARPRLSDLRDGGAIEQDADLVAFLYRIPQDEGDKATDVIPIGLDVAKQRNGPTGLIDLLFFASETRFEAAAKVSGEDVPK